MVQTRSGKRVGEDSEESDVSDEGEETDSDDSDEEEHTNLIGEEKNNPEINHIKTRVNPTRDRKRFSPD
jgi:hypothetical protein